MTYQTVSDIIAERDQLRAELAASQAREARLRAELATWVADDPTTAQEWLAAHFPTDDAALRGMIEREVERRLIEAGQYVTNDASREEYGRQERAKERERCAQTVLDVGEKHWPSADETTFAAAIRNLGDEK